LMFIILYNTKDISCFDCSFFCWLVASTCYQWRIEGIAEVPFWCMLPLSGHSSSCSYTYL
jgi:hypothetical protein